MGCTKPVLPECRGTIQEYTNKRKCIDSLAAAALRQDAVVINLGQNDYGKPAHIDPKTGKPVKNHLPSPSQWATHYTWFLGNMTKLYAPKVPTFFLACGGMAPKYCNDTAAAVRQMNAAGMKNVVFMVRLDLPTARAT